MFLLIHFYKKNKSIIYMNQILFDSIFMSLIFYIITTRPNLFHKLIPLDDILARTILFGICYFAFHSYKYVEKKNI